LILNLLRCSSVYTSAEDTKPRVSEVGTQVTKHVESITTMKI
jgi:hypothetical protein